MRGPIDFIIVGFEGNTFDGSVLRALDEAISKDIIRLIALSLLVKDSEGKVSVIDVKDSEDSYIVHYAELAQQTQKHVEQADIDEVSDLLENDTSAGLLIIEQLWAKPLKQALLDAHGELVAEGRIHPEAAAELAAAA